MFGSSFAILFHVYAALPFSEDYTPDASACGAPPHFPIRFPLQLCASSESDGGWGGGVKALRPLASEMLSWVSVP